MTVLRLRIAVTGAAGLVGTGVVKAALLDGHSVVALDRLPLGSLPPQDRYEYKQVDLMDYEAYKAAVQGCNGIVHLAAVYNTHDDEGNWTSNVVHNMNVSMSYNTLCIAGDLGIDRVVLASSVNSIGMVFSKHPRFDYLPLDEAHPFYPEDAYSISKHIVEIQADSFARQIPSMRIATLRFHGVTPDAQCTTIWLDQRGGSWKDLWGWVSVSATAQSCVLGLTAPYERFPRGTHETFFIVAPTTAQQRDSEELLLTKFRIKDVRRGFRGSNVGFFDTSKARKMLGWEEKAPNWWRA